MDKKKSNSNVVKFNRWGYIFLIPFFVTYIVFSLIPLFSTIYNSFFENYRSGLKQIGPNFVGITNYINLLSSPEIWKYLVNTLIMWVGGFIPQITIALLLAYWFSDPSLRLKGQRFFKTVIYMPNLIMASAFSMLFFALFSDSGPVNQILLSLGFIKEPFKFFQYVIASRVLVMLMNFLMWFGNTTILLMAGMLGIDSSLYEAAQVDGATASQVFFKITMPILRPIFTYVLITSLIGGLQMFDVPQILTNGRGNPTDSLTTVIMLLNRYLTSKDVGRGGALSVFLFVVTGILSLVVFRMNSSKDKD
ncbi:carbohydrate ABC transporter membrane protein 1, CUT1 family [Butyrivibrio proteoclasticus]|uniref:Carbohydrate ABC transporter membrane protein 1, CUT1 family n=1 Tax=Butyrivibrio proteoclasticus TaxID=43305 RepID=A0A1I5T529_9FIRM|nr:sugar ABC transporter permease [Butyrivibrio proteoclasticus]SFP78154.1 carbohydrate ABC transporter membrane protein 1, CUT1 family [Butyrivibrio proteoclasticus]